MSCFVLQCVNGYTGQLLANDQQFNMGYFSGCIPCAQNVQQCSSSGAFVSTCQPGTFPSTSLAAMGSCQACSVANCGACASASTCARCLTGYTLASGACLSCNDPACVTCTTPGFCSQCVDGMFPINGICSGVCPATCRQCSSAQMCTKCFTGLSSTGFTIVNGICQACSANCQYVVDILFALS